MTLLRALILGALVLVVTGTVAVFMDVRQFLHTPVSVGQDEVIWEYRAGVPFRAAADELAALGVVSRPRYLAWYARYKGLAQRAQAGEYRIVDGMTPILLLDHLVSGEVVTHRLTLVEGWNFREVRRALAAHQAIGQTLGDKPATEVMAAIGHEGEHPEGRFFPDTYSFPRGTTDIVLLKQAYTAMQSRLAGVWQDVPKDSPLKTPYDVLVLASIVEKETGAADERPLIAGVFLRRLRLGMRLQTDPTVIYGLGEAFDGNLRKRDLQTDTPYNTYTRHGLPPTPIAMPGADALRAVVEPADGKALYFVSRGDGTHVFSESLEAHNQAVREYQLRRRKR